MGKILFAKTHEWADIDGNSARMGITDFAQKQLKDIVFINLPEIGMTVKCGEILCDVESVKAVSELYSPVCGKVTKVNEELLDSPERINENAMEAWICEFETTGVSNELMTEVDYKTFIKK